MRSPRRYWPRTRMSVESGPPRSPAPPMPGGALGNAGQHGHRNARCCSLRIVSSGSRCRSACVLIAAKKSQGTEGGGEGQRSIARISAGATCSISACGPCIKRSARLPLTSPRGGHLAPVAAVDAPRVPRLTFLAAVIARDRRPHLEGIARKRIGRREPCPEPLHVVSRHTLELARQVPMYPTAARCPEYDPGSLTDAQDGASPMPII